MIPDDTWTKTIKCIADLNHVMGVNFIREAYLFLRNIKYIIYKVTSTHQ